MEHLWLQYQQKGRALGKEVELLTCWNEEALGQPVLMVEINGINFPITDPEYLLAVEHWHGEEENS